MKLPFDLGVKLFFRLLLPGFILTLGVAPILLASLSAVQLTEQWETAIVITMIVLGWMVVAADMPIYMLLEGRRYWPHVLRRWLWEAETRRLARINERIDAYYKAENPSDDVRREYLEASVKKREFPMGADGQVLVGYPSRLGNTIAAFEQYSKSRYGIEATFYWPRIWVNLSKDLREELDGQQAMADSAVYMAFASAVCAILWIVYAALTLFIEPRLDALASFLPSPTVCALIALTFGITARLSYGTAVFTNAQYGVLFMATIDSHATKLSDYVDMAGISGLVLVRTGEVPDKQERFEIVRRYLQYFNVKTSNERRPKPFTQVAARGASQTDSASGSTGPEKQA